MRGWCYWCDNYSAALRDAIVNATQEVKPVCADCWEHSGDDATGELNSVEVSSRGSEEER